jgi:radical SAM superfamily enzyme YgiQ (UPF0313 family)
MKVAFMYATFENIGIEMLSSMLKKEGHSTRLFYDPQLFDDLFYSKKYLGKFFSFKKKIFDDLKRYKPDMILFSVVSADYSWACEYSSEIKKIMNVPIVFGGIHVTSMPEEVLQNKFVDYVVVGEGDFAVVDLMNNIESGNINYSIKNVWFKKNGLIIKNSVRPIFQDLDKLPYPDKELYKKHGQPFITGYTILTVRGCPNRCTYCNHDVYKNIYPNNNTYIRRRSVKNAVSELADSKKKYKIKFIRIIDDDFVRELSRLELFCKLYQKVNVPYVCIAHPTNVTVKSVKALKLSNCKQVAIGLQNINENLRTKILNRKETNEDVKRMIILLNRYKIRCIIDLIMDLPSSTSKHMKEAFEFFCKYTPAGLCMPWINYFPKTTIVDIAYKHGILDKKSIRKLELKPNKKTLFILDNKIHKEITMKYQNLLTLLLVSKRLAKFMYRTKLFLSIPSRFMLLLRVFSYFRNRTGYELELLRNPRRYFYQSLRKLRTL